jgi:hypothetical protein
LVGELEAALVEDDRVGPAQLAHGPQQHLLERLDQGLVVQPHHAELLEVARAQLGPGHPLEQPHRPRHPRHAAHPVQVVLRQGLDVVDELERVDTRVLQVVYALDVTNKPIYVGQQLDVFIDVGAPAVKPPESE